MAGINFSLFALVVVLISLAVVTTGQAPQPCCAANVYSVGLAQAVHDDSSTEGDLEFQEGMYYYDGNNNRTAFNITVTPLLVNQTSTKLYIIQDYKKKLQYVVINNKQCSKTPLDAPFPSSCLPDKAIYMGAPNLGQKFPVHRWSVKPSGQILAIDITVTIDTCAPVTGFSLQGTTNQHTAVSSEFYNYTPTINNPDQKFTPPGFCPKEISTSNRAVPLYIESIIGRLSVPKPFFL